MLCGYERLVGRRRFSLGRSPLRIAGTASVVLSETVVALRYQVASRARRPNAGKRFASIVSPGPISEIAGSSSTTTRTTGGVGAGPAADATAAAGRSSPAIGEKMRNSARKTSGAGPSTVRTDRTGAARA